MVFSLGKAIVFATLTLWAGSAFPQAPSSRQEALAALGHPDEAVRAEAIVWIARHGSGADDAALYERLRDESPRVRSYAEQALWLLWSRSGDDTLDRLMERGIADMQAGQHLEAVAVFSEVIRRRPAFAEGWNKRATALYLAGQYRRSLADCEQVVRRNPRHFGALSGAGLNHVALEEFSQALTWFRRALEVNPNMPAVQEQVRQLEERLRGRST